MNKQIDALKQALEALEWIAAQRTGGMIQRKATEPIAALRAALAEPQEAVRCPLCNYQYGHQIGCKNNPFDIALAAAAQSRQPAEPVQEPFCYHDGHNIVGKEYADHSDVFPLYTSPNLEQQKPVKFKCTVVDDAHPNGVPLSQWGKQHEMQPCAGRNCGSTNPNLHSAECFEDYEKATGMNQRKPLTQAEVVDGFCSKPHDVQFVSVFNAGVRFAEAAHDIKE